MTECETSDAPAEIVQDEVLGGEPRLFGHRIGVYHIWVHVQDGDSVEDIAESVYPHLRQEQVEVALEYAREHEDEMQELRREREREHERHMEEARREKQKALTRACPECGGQLVPGEELALALVRCSSCGEEHVVKQLLND